MASKDIAPVLTREFVLLRIDSERMKGGTDLVKRYTGKPSTSLPWFVFLDGDANPLVTSDGPKGNCGFPAEDYEIAHFKTMLEKVKRHLTDDDIEKLIKSLEEANRKTT